MQTVEFLKNSLENMFDFEEAYTFHGIEFQLYGKYYMRNSRFFASKKVELYAYSIFEHILYMQTDLELKSDFFHKIDSTIIENIKEIVEPNDEHMSSVLTLIIECDSLDSNLKDEILKYKRKKSFMFGLKGWVDIKLIVLARKEKKAYENKLAKGDAEKLKLLSLL